MIEERIKTATDFLTFAKSFKGHFEGFKVKVLSYAKDFQYQNSKKKVLLKIVTYDFYIMVYSTENERHFTVQK